jgi:hypothetical protein
MVGHGGERTERREVGSADVPHLISAAAILLVWCLLDLVSNGGSMLGEDGGWWDRMVG